MCDSSHSVAVFCHQKLSKILYTLRSEQSGLRMSTRGSSLSAPPCPSSPTGMIS